jgi:predicted phage terminase large subunit-like protein
MNAYTRTLRDAILRSDFYAFAQKSFEVLHPSSTLQTNWNLELIAVHLGDIMTGKELRLILNAPPRSLKSLLGSVAFPAFVLGHDPTRQIICVSYTQDLANDLSSMRHRLMESDDYCRLFPRVCLYLLEQGGRWKHVKLPAIALEDTLISLPGRQHTWKEGEPLQPQREPISILESLKKELGLPRFNAQYLEEPVPESGNMLKSNWLKYCEVNPSRQPGDQIVQSWDTAVKAAETSKFSVCLTFLVHNKNEYYLADVLRQKLEFPELNKLVIAHAQKYNADVIIIEDQMSGSSLIQTAKRNGLQGVVAIRPDSDKRTRMYSQTPKLEAGSLILPKSAPWISDFREEYLAFPEGRYNDQIDALSQFLLWRTNSEHSRFHFDFGYDDESPGAPSADSIAYFFRRRR